MAVRSEEDAREHDDLIRTMADFLKSKEYTDVKADVEGYDRPDVVKSPRGEFVPDITCYSPGRYRKYIVLEVETCRSIFDPHTVDEWDVFGKEARIRAGEFHVAVPKRCGIEPGTDLVRRRISQLGFNYRPHMIWST